MSDIAETNELLEKKCPRCGKASANSSNPSGRCSACLKKLATAKKTPGHWQRAQTKADDALRRQKGKNGTAHKKSSGLGSRDSIVKQTQSAEKKTGQKLSPDRKNNSKGYAASNTRMVPEKLNRGRHHVDEKKLRNWKKRLKKSEIDTASLYSLMKAKFHDDPNALELIKSLGAEGLEQYIELFDIESFEKGAALKLEPTAEPSLPSIHNEIGKVHAVEVHPDMDHLYRAKGLIKESNRPHLSIQHFKKAGFSKNIIDRLPRTADGRVTPEMIDQHIANLPKTKVNVRVVPYKLGAQQHRSLEGKRHQYGLKVELHPDEANRMNDDVLNLWGEIRDLQHRLSDDRKENKDAIGWARIDPHAETRDNHWHIDEIQSDFQNIDKIKNKARRSNNIKHSDDLLRALSQDHEDPQHLIHSAVNALGRKLGIKSMSMDTSADQARQSGLIQDRGNRQQEWVNHPAHMHRGGWDRLVREHIQNNPISNETHNAIWDTRGQNMINDQVQNDPDFKNVVDKLGVEGIRHMVNAITHEETKDPNHALFNGSNYRHELDDAFKSGNHGDFIKKHKDTVQKVVDLSDNERDALSTFLNMYSGTMEDHIGENVLGFGQRPDERAPTGYMRDIPPEEQETQRKKAERALPIHQIKTYNHRPKRLGMKTIPKDTIFPPEYGKSSAEIQYMNLHKKIQEIRDYLETLKKSKS